MQYQVSRYGWTTTEENEAERGMGQWQLPRIFRRKTGKTSSIQARRKEARKQEVQGRPRDRRTGHRHHQWMMSFTLADEPPVKRGLILRRVEAK
ncbi:hypothetical protein FGIG_10251 [Fasciola gigantica]|uniref:Uncharacterized protein n=1 Tax=Fasciola gigantica TaxID=46835 RepID=A0A504YZF7_FASGI|nr:hypothetical protein FGIG_10251 [Fasciola gigantica]